MGAFIYYDFSETRYGNVQEHERQSFFFFYEVLHGRYVLIEWTTVTEEYNPNGSQL